MFHVCTCVYAGEHFAGNVPSSRRLDRRFSEFIRISPGAVHNLHSTPSHLRFSFLILIKGEKRQMFTYHEYAENDKQKTIL